MPLNKSAAAEIFLNVQVLKKFFMFSKVLILLTEPNSVIWDNNTIQLLFKK